jgi:hypothetical protein
MKVTFSKLGIYGQLGNQMFQYALLLGIKHKLKVPIVIDPETVKTSYLFEFFNLEEYIEETFKPDNFYKEVEFSYNKEVFDIKEDTDFEGYYQTDKYFKHCSDIVRKEFTFKENVVKEVKQYLDKLEGKKLVSLHVRRGSYLGNTEFHPLCKIDYYNKAMDLLDDGNTVFVCTSDDKDWCEKNLNRSNILFNFNSLIYDMCLISNCHDHIIANSSFSWWGSWLSDNPDKKIIAPKTWFGPAAKHLDTKDIYCNNFIKI